MDPDMLTAKTKSRRSTFSPTVALVTGAASGIGAGEVARLRNRGVNVVAADLDPEITGMYSGDDGVLGVVVDVTDGEAVSALVSRAEETFGPVDMLFHSAGIMPGGRIADVPADRATAVMDVNYGGTVRAIEGVLHGMLRRHRGQIVVLGSLTGYVPTRGFSAYSASKSAVDTYVETLHHEVKGDGVQVMLVAPNAVKTPLLNQATGGPRFVTALAGRSRAPGLSTTDDVLDAVDRGLARKRSVIVPGGHAIWLLRRFSPALTWQAGRIIGA
jgi:NADP-dependent 3-hydroxy acid dehydrogenase YdfG